MRLLYCILISATTTLAEPPARLDQPVEHLRFEKTPIAAALRTLARAHHFTVLVDPDVTGDVTVELSQGTVRTALEALTEPAGFAFEETPQAVAVRYRQTRLYTVDYPQLTRSGSGSASITLGGAANSSGGGLGNGFTPLNGAPTAATLAGQGLNNQISDATQVSISQENENTFWSHLETELRAMLREGDGLVMNRFSGIVQVRAPARAHDSIRTFIELVNHRITQQVEIEARLVEVTLRDEQKLGVDWDLATSSLGSDATVKGASSIDVGTVGGALLGANSFTATLGLGRASAVIHALKEQGDVRTVAQPRLRVLNNQTGFVKVGEDRPFFRLQQSTTFQQGGTTVPINQTQENFSISTITIGTILAITPQIDAQGVITLDVLPAITRLQAIITSPDGKQTAPAVEVKQASTIVRLRDGETAVIGGLISEESGETTRAVPVLGQAPIVGKLFRTKASRTNRTELVIFLTPRRVGL